MSDISPTSPVRNVWKAVRASLVIAGVQVVCSLLLAFAYKGGLIGGETMLRGVLVMIGLVLAAVGNRIPKITDGPPPHTLPLAVLRQKTMRAAGWAMMLGGLMFAGLWAFAPLDVAQVGAMIALGGSLTLMCGFVARWIFAYHHRYGREPAPSSED
jgi:hypothetical protein